MSIYCIHTSQIVYEVLNTEVIIVDFNTGNYYVLSNTAKDIWRCIEEKLTYDQMVNCLALHYSENIEKIKTDLTHFLHELVDKGLIYLGDTPQEGSLTIPTLMQKEYVSPDLRMYTDVQNLLLLDPIHEVTEAGWPHVLS